VIENREEGIRLKITVESKDEMRIQINSWWW
jgi:hypothetical protein